MNTEQHAILDEWADMVVKQLSRPRRKTPHLELAARIHSREEQTEIQNNCRNGWDDEPTGLI